MNCKKCDKNLYIFTECGSKVGFGHIYRTIPFYNLFISFGYNVIYIVDTDSDVSLILKDKEYKAYDWLSNIKIINELNRDAIIFLDSISITQDDIFAIQDYFCQLIVIDDYNRYSYKDAIVIDWTPYAEKSNYHAHNINNNVCLLGLEYSVLRKKFIESDKYIFKNNKTLTIIMGGADIRLLSDRLANNIIENPNIKVHVVIGPGATHDYNFDKRIILHNSINEEELIKLFLLSDLVVSAGGQTLIELAVLRVPTIAIQVIDNQKYDIQGLKYMGFIKDIYLWNENNLIDKIKHKVYELMQSEDLLCNYLNNFHCSDIGNGVHKLSLILDKYGNNREQGICNIM